MELCKDLCKTIVQALEGSQDGVAVFDAEDHICFINPPMASILGFQVEDVVGLSFEQIFRNAFAKKTGVAIQTENIDDWIEQALNKRRCQMFRSFEVEHRSKSWFLISEQQNVNGYILVTSADITHLKELENNLLKASKVLEIKAFVDELTEINNRRAFTELGKKEVNRCLRNKSPLSLLLVDIDHFKQINDTYGHQTGDLALKLFAQKIGAQLRDYDIFSRVGGEEFAIILPETAKDEASNIAERVRLSAAGIIVETENGHFSFTISIGQTMITSHSNLDSLYAEADKALYRAKQSGRNQVINYIN